MLTNVHRTNPLQLETKENPSFAILCQVLGHSALKVANAPMLMNFNRLLQQNKATIDCDNKFQCELLGEDGVGVMRYRVGKGEEGRRGGVVEGGGSVVGL